MNTSSGKPFHASLDKSTKLITTVVSIILLAIMIRAFLYLETNPVSAYISGIATIAVFGYCLLFRPLNYLLTADTLIVHRLVKDVTIPRNAITKVRSVGEGELKGIVRVFGVGGLFGYFGIFGNKNGDIHVHATNWKNSIMIETPARNFIITPDDSSAFLQEFL
jgi:hypothetical protein